LPKIYIHVTISSPYSGGIINRRCAETVNRNWCAVSFYTFGRTASFGCANDFAIPFGAQTCGDGPGFINQQGCRMANTPFGPCYFCCCRGGSCNHPAVFARDAASVLFSGQYPQQMSWNSARSLIDFRTAMISVYIVVCIQ
uniref:CX domain-containing protein n=1 Tax=Angiostrongylus cantonensis TaxID=6313 RepID=A0A0K0DDG7_ANGCA